MVFGHLPGEKEAGEAALIPHRHFLLHKPYGYISQFVCDQPRKRLLGDLFDFPTGTMPVGRLDEHSEGLLLLTTDGLLSNAIRKNGAVEKEYFAQVDGCVTDEALRRLSEGVAIQAEGRAFTTLPCMVHRITDPLFGERARRIRDDRHGPTSWISITLTEGKNRQVRRMTAAVGHPTLRLVRVRIGSLTLDDLQPGACREVFDMSYL